MQIILVKYIQLFCVTFFFNNNVKCDQLLLKNDNEDHQIYGISACTGKCIKNNGTLTLEQCYEDCVEFFSDKNFEKPKRIYRNLEIRFICRDDTSFVIEIATKNYNENNNSNDDKKILKDNFNYDKIDPDYYNDNKTYINNNSNNDNNYNNTNDYNYEFDYNEDDYIGQQQQQKHQQKQKQGILQYSTVFDDEINNNNNNNNNDNYDDNTSNQIYVLKIHEKNKFPIEKQIYLTNSNLIKIDNLRPNTKYHISATVVYPNNEYSLIANGLTYNTLKKKYIPKKITNVKIDYITDKLNLHDLSAKLTWKPAADQTCYYDIAWYSPEIMTELDISVIEIRDIEQLYIYTIKNLSFGTKYQVAVRGKNTKDLGRESELVWHQIETPTCLEWYKNTSICPPSKPENLYVTEKLISENEYTLNISWKTPRFLPNYYTIQIRDFERNSSEINIITKNISKEESSIYLPNIILKGLDYEVNLTAFSDGGTSSSILMVPIHEYIRLPENFHLKKITIGILISVLCIIIIFIAVLLIYFRFVKLKRLKEHCNKIEAIKKEKTMNPNTNFELTSEKMQSNYIDTNDIINSLSTIIIDNIQKNLQEKLFIDDEKEIDPNNLKLYKVLGEGAFGLVRHGILKIDEEKSIEVAVKMLKDHPSTDDIKAFRREIDVMKSVGYHPNIVGIIGHYTQNINELMLLTEYCSLGNLQNYLRAEWRHMNKIAFQKLNKSLIISQDVNDNKRNSNTFNYNRSSSEKTQIKYKNISFNDTSLSLITLPILASFTSSEIKRFTTFPLTTIENNLLTTDNNIDDVTIDSSDKNNQKDLLTNDMTVINKGYELNGLCTNSCKCKVDIILKNYHNNTYKMKNDESINDKTNFENSTETTTDDNNDYDEDDNEIDKNDKHDDHNHENKDNGKNNNNHHQKIRIPEVEIQNCDCNNIEKKLRQQQFEMEQKQKIQIQHKKKNENENQNEKNKKIMTLKSKNCYKLTANDKEKAPFISVIIDDDDHEPLTNIDLLLIAKQIGLGMEFLAKNKVVHRDLAARNVLVCSDRTVKIADFGLSRDIYQENIYKKIGNGKLPIKWLAIESMTHQVYTSQSDVWSYGVLLYEIVTLGGSPYPSIPNSRLLNLLKSGYRMEKPKTCDEEFYSLMLSCWDSNPNKRPTFTDIVKILDEFLTNQPDNHIFNNFILTELSDKKAKSVSAESYLEPI